MILYLWCIFCVTKNNSNLWVTLWLFFLWTNDYIFLYCFYLDILYDRILNVTNCNWAERSHALILIQFRGYYWTIFYFYYYFILCCIWWNFTDNNCKLILYMFYPILIFKIIYIIVVWWETWHNQYHEKCKKKLF